MCDHPLRRLVLAAAASCEMLLLGGIAKAQPVQVFEETPSLEELRRIIIPGSHGPGRAIVIRRPGMTERPDSSPSMAAPTPLIAAPQTNCAPTAKMPASQTRDPKPETAISAPAGPTVQALQAKTTVPVSQAAAGIVALRINFALDSALLRSISYAALDHVAELMKEEPELKLRIEGHTDALGSADYNFLLSRRRAFAVADYLVHHRDVESDRLAVVGKGKMEPLTENPYDPRNRRVQFVRDTASAPAAAPISGSTSENPVGATGGLSQLATETIPSAVPGGTSMPSAAAQQQLPTAKELPPVVNQSDHPAHADRGQQDELATGPESPAIDRQRLAPAEELILSRAVDNSAVLESLAAEIGPLEQAAQRGDPAAAYDVGYCYEHGIGVRVDRAKAYAYYIRSAVAHAELKVRAAALSGWQRADTATCSTNASRHPSYAWCGQ